MVGPFAVAFDLFFTFTPFVLLIGTIYSYLKYRSFRAQRDLLVAEVLTVAWLSFYGISVFYKTEDYLFFKTLKPNNVASINIGNKTWSREEDIQKIVSLLNQVEWHIDNHDAGAKNGSLNINLTSGSTMDFPLSWALSI